MLLFYWVINLRSLHLSHFGTLNWTSFFFFYFLLLSCFGLFHLCYYYCFNVYFFFTKWDKGFFYWGFWLLNLWEFLFSKWDGASSTGVSDFSTFGSFCSVDETRGSSIGILDFSTSGNVCLVDETRASSTGVSKFSTSRSFFSHSLVTFSISDFCSCFVALNGALSSSLFESSPSSFCVQSNSKFKHKNKTKRHWEIEKRHQSFYNSSSLNQLY